MTDEEHQESKEPFVPRDRTGRRLTRADYFDPLSEDGSEVPLRPSAMALIEAHRAKVDQARRMSEHFQMEDGHLPAGEQSVSRSAQSREAAYQALRDFPPIPPHVLRDLERILGTYGLPLMELSSDNAAFVVRRVMSDYHRVRMLHRDYTKGALFTPEELLQLLRALKLRPWQLAQVVDPDRSHVVHAAIMRWLSGQHVPVGRSGTGPAVRVGRLIEQHVRRPSKGRATPAGTPSGAARRRRRRQELGEGMTIPLASAASRKEESGDPPGE